MLPDEFEQLQKARADRDKAERHCKYLSEKTSHLEDAVESQQLEIASLIGQLKDVRNPLNRLAEAAHGNSVEHGFWDPAPEFGTSIALVHSEVTEAFDEWRAGRPFTETYYGSDEKPEGIPSELADILIRVFDLAGRYGIDLDGAVLVKMNYNESRPYRHGGKLA